MDEEREAKIVKALEEIAKSNTTIATCVTVVTITLVILVVLVGVQMVKAMQ